MLYFTRSKEMAAFVILDAALTAASMIIAFLLRFDGTIPGEYSERFFVFTGILIILNVYFISRARLYSFAWAFVGLQDLTKLVQALSYASGIFAVIVYLDIGITNFFTGFPRSVIFIAYFLNLIFIGALRISRRLLNELRNQMPTQGNLNTLIAGAGEEGEKTIRALRSEKGRRHNIIGIVDDTKDKQKTFIHGIPILGKIEDIPKLTKEYEIKSVIIALPSKEGELIKATMRRAREAEIQNVKIIPPFADLFDKKIAFETLKDVSIEDLLGREPAKIETEKINDFLKDKNVLVTGAAGSIGSELTRQICKFLPKNIIVLDFNESGIFDLEKEIQVIFPGQKLTPIVGNIVDKIKMEKIFEASRPDVVFHAAAYKHVPLMEEFPEEAVRDNVFGTLTVAETAKKYGAKKFVLISTDKAVKPLSIMGKTKRAAELVVNNLSGTDSPTKFVSVRFGNVLASRGSVIPLFQEQIKRRAALTVTHPDMTRYFMTIPEAALLVMEAGAIGKGGEIFILDMGKPVKIVDLANEIIKLSGLEPDKDIPIVFTGVRPGEKIFEELLTAEEGSQATTWEKIFISKNTGFYNAQTMAGRLSALKEALPGDTKKLREHLDAFIKEPGETA